MTEFAAPTAETPARKGKRSVVTRRDLEEDQGLKDPFFRALNPNDPAVQLFMLGERVTALTKEKEELEGHLESLNIRVAKMEKSFNMGAGVLMILPILGGIVGTLLAYGKVIFRPWTTGTGP